MSTYFFLGEFYEYLLIVMLILITKELF